MVRKDEQVGSQPNIAIGIVRDDGCVSQTTAFKTTLFRMPSKDEIPDFDYPSTPFAIVSPTNTNYIRDFAQYIYEHNLFRPITLAIANNSETPADNLLLKLEVENINSEDIFRTSLVSKPNRHPLLSMVNSSSLSRGPGWKLSHKGNISEAALRLETLRPKEEIRTEVPLYLGRALSGELKVMAFAYANNLRVPSVT